MPRNKDFLTGHLFEEGNKDGLHYDENGNLADRAGNIYNTAGTEIMIKAPNKHLAAAREEIKRRFPELVPAVQEIEAKRLAKKMLEEEGRQSRKKQNGK